MKFEAGYHSRSSSNPTHFTWYCNSLRYKRESSTRSTFHSWSSGPGGSRTCPGSGLFAAFLNLSGEKTSWIFILGAIPIGRCFQLAQLLYRVPSSGYRFFCSDDWIYNASRTAKHGRQPGNPVVGDVCRLSLFVDLDCVQCSVELRSRYSPSSWQGAINRMPVKGGRQIWLRLGDHIIQHTGRLPYRASITVTDGLALTLGEEIERFLCFPFSFSFSHSFLILLLQLVVHQSYKLDFLNALQACPSRFCNYPFPLVAHCVDLRYTMLRVSSVPTFLHSTLGF